MLWASWQVVHWMRPSGNSRPAGLDRGERTIVLQTPPWILEYPPGDCADPTVAEARIGQLVL